MTTKNLGTRLQKILDETSMGRKKNITYFFLNFLSGCIFAILLKLEIAQPYIIQLAEKTNSSEPNQIAGFVILGIGALIFWKMNNMFKAVTLAFLTAVATWVFINPPLWVWCVLSAISITVAAVIYTKGGLYNHVYNELYPDTQRK